MSKEESNGNSGCGCFLLLIIFFIVIPECDNKNGRIKSLEKKVEQLEKKNAPVEQPEKPLGEKKGTEQCLRS